MSDLQLKAEAERLRKLTLLSKFIREGGDWESVRDQIDQHTDGDLDCWQLDKLTDMVTDGK